MDQQPQLGTIFFHVGLLAIIVLLVDETLIRGGLAIIPGMLLAQRAMGGSIPKSNGDWSEVHDQRMNEHVRAHLEKLLGYFREFYATNHLMTTGEMGAEEALSRASDLEKDLNRLLDDVTAGPSEVSLDTHVAPPVAAPVAT